MFVFLSKLLPPFVYPLGLALLLLILGLLLDGRTRPRLARLRQAALLLALLLLWLGGNRWVAMGLARSLEWQHLPQGEPAAAPVIVLLGGGSEPGEPPNPLPGVNSAGDRILYAAELYQRGKAPYILVSGGLLDWTTAQHSPAQDQADLLQRLGVPAQAIWLQPKSRNTYEDALFSAEMLRQKGIGRILLVTSASHMPRSVRLFLAQGLEVEPAPADFQVTFAGWQALFNPDPRVQLLGLMPSAENLALTGKSLKEYLGMWVYHIQGYY